VSRRIEWTLLGLVLAAGAWLRFSHLDLLQFQSDETTAVILALRFVQSGQVPLAGLMSSVGVTNPPLFIYLLIPIFAFTSNPVVACCTIAGLGLASVAVCWWIGRTYYGAVTGLVAAGLFAVAPWAIIHTRVIWAQDLVPVFTTLTMWAVHALVLGRRPRAIFWVILLPLCVVQVHFAGLAFVAAVVVILLWLRPKVDWRWAAAGAAGAAVLLLPYLAYQTKNGWADFRRALQTMGGQGHQIPKGMTVHPEFGYRLPQREPWGQALAIMNSGQIEDVLGLSAGRQFDLAKVYDRNRRGSPAYFDETLTWGTSLLLFQRVWFLVALGYQAVRAVRAWRAGKAFPFFSVADEAVGRGAWIMWWWILGPLAVFWATGLWTYLTYYVILYPVHYLACGMMVQAISERWKQTRQRMVIGAVVVAVLLGNFVFMMDFYRFVGRYGGAHGTYGTSVGFKRAAARFVAKRTDVKRLMAEGRLMQMDSLGKVEPPQLEFQFLALQESPPATEITPTNLVVLVVDRNRSNFPPPSLAELTQMARLTGIAETNFGPMHVYFLKR